jgi:uncharacterized RDD family membrane protein YckC
MKVESAPLPGSPEAAGAEQVPAAAPEPRYAGFWRRLAAFAVDLGVTSLMFFVLAVLLPILLGPWLGVPGGAVLVVWAAVLWQAVSWLYWGIMESSVKQGTMGKVLLNILVTDVQGRRLSFRRATVRHFLKILSTLTALAGFAMIATTARKQGLHDLVSGSLVVFTPHR